jgi:hypothetical protein
MKRSVAPQTARPVAVAAGLCFSTVSVKAAIQVANAKAPPIEIISVYWIQVLLSVSGFVWRGRTL